MKTLTFVLLLLLTGLDLRAQAPAPGPGGMPSLPYRPFRRPGGTNGAVNPMFSTSPIRPAAAAPGAPGAPGNFPGMPGNVPNGGANGAPGSGADATAADQPAEEMLHAGDINFEGVDVNEVLNVYAKLIHRTILRANLPQASIVLKTETPLTKAEAIEALQAVLAMNGIEVVNFGDKFAKALAVGDANTAGAPIDNVDASQLPEMGSYVTHVVQLKYLKPSVVMPLLTPFSKLPNSVFAIDDNGILVLRDNAENVKRMLEMVERIDVSVPAEYISEVIPIKYAQAADIASALNSLGGAGGGSTVSIGNSPTGGRVSGLGSSGSSFNTGVGGAGSPYGGATGGYNGLSGGAGSSAFGQNRSFGSTTAATPNGTPSTGSTFQQRLQSIIQKASGGEGKGQDNIQVFGETKIIADQRSNSLLVFATRQDMENIKHVIAQLDVLLSQVLIEAVIMDVNIGSSFNFGVSVAQNPKQFGSTGAGITNGILGAGGFNNGESFANLLANTVGTNSTAGATSIANNLGSGLSYFGNIGPTWDVAMSAIASDNNATVIQRPRIQTSQAKPATFFVGNTVPYVTGTYYGGGYAGGNSSQYSQLSVGVELDVTPFINPDGLVVMDINQEIDDVNGYTAIDGNQVPNTDKRTLSSEIAVRNQDTIMLGGFIRSDKSNSRSGVPFLQDIPVLGALFSNKTTSKNREELVVLMRPTVLKTPEESSAMTLREERRLPGVSAAAADDAAYERQMIEAERKAEKARAKKGQNDGFYNSEGTMLQGDSSPLVAPSTNSPAPEQPVYQFEPIIQKPSSTPGQPATPGQPGQPAPNQ